VDLTRSVLLFENNPAEAGLLRQALDRDARDVFSLAVVDSLEAGLVRLEQQAFDLVLLDLELPGCQGLEALERLQSAFAGLPVVVLAGQQGESLGVQALRLGAQDYLLKGPEAWGAAAHVLRSVTRRLQARDRYALFFEHSRDMILMVRPGDGRILEANPAACAAYGYSRRELLQLKIYDLRAVAAREVVNGQMRRAGGEGALFEAVHMRRDGSLFPVEVSSQRIAEGEEPILVSVIRDISQRKQDEAQLYQERERLRLVFESTRDILFLIDREYGLVMANQAFHAVLGDIGRGLVSGERVLAAGYSPQFSAAWQGYYDRVLGGETFDLETGYPWQDGWHDLDCSFTPVCGEDGAVGGALVVLRDVTGRKQAERLLSASEAQYRSLVESTDAMIAMLDGQGLVHYANDRLARYLQMPVSSLAGRALEDLLQESYAALFRELVQQVLASRQGQVVELPIEEQWLRVSIQPVDAPQGQAPMALLNATDITPLKAAQAELLELNRSLEQRVEQRTAEVQDLYDNAPCGYHSLDAEGCFVHINDTELKWLGYTREEMIGHSLLEFLTPEGCLVFYQDFPYLKQSGQVIDSEVDLVRKDGSSFPVQVSATAVLDAFGGFLMSRSTVLDITERRRAEQALRQKSEDLRQANAALENAARLKDEFLASMSHELRTPLTGILGLSEALQLNTYGALDQRQLKVVRNIESSGKHLLDLINDILDLSKIEAGGLELQIEPCSLADICQASLQLTRGMAQKKRQRVGFTMDSSSILLNADPRRLKQMLVNLLSNAVKFTPEGGELGLEVQGEGTGAMVRLVVWDRGIGIRAVDFERLFRPFVQIDSSLSRQNSGTGLGLSLVRRLAELHGGSIQVESIPGQGSRFIITLPRGSQDKAAAAGSLPAPGSRAVERVAGGLPGSPLVLVTDDNEMILDMVSDYLRGQGCRVLTAHSGGELLERADADRPQVFLVDIQMPGIDGLEAIRRLRLHPDPAVAAAPVIAITALVMPGDRQRCMEAGADEYLTKPLILPDLVESIRRLLGRGDMPGQGG
jgi:PAS domain S-box-containing protein